jgi:hypothetical protein
MLGEESRGWKSETHPAPYTAIASRSVAEQFAAAFVDQGGKYA